MNKKWLCLIRLPAEKGFSLIELLVAIAIMAVIMALALPNYLGARERARDAKKKSEMNQLKASLQMYYNDYKTYPPSASCAAPAQISGCGASGTSCCPCNATYDFAVGDSCTTVYMKKYITALSGMFYSSTGETFCAKILLENKSDPDLAVNASKCAGICTGFTACGTDNYCVCSD